MCARFTQFGIRQIQENFGLQAPIPDLEPHYNIAPTDVVPIVIMMERPELQPMVWGLVPGWSKDPKSGANLINARSETVREKPSFRGAFKYRRALVPTDGFYEWQGEKSPKQPWFISATAPCIAFAGIWEEWESADGYLLTFSVITTESNGPISEIHDRMPVILEPDQFPTWLKGTPAEAAQLLRPYDDLKTVMWPVDRRMSNPRAEGEDLIKPLPEIVANLEQSSLF